MAAEYTVIRTINFYTCTEDPATQMVPELNIPANFNFINILSLSINNYLSVSLPLFSSLSKFCDNLSSFVSVVEMMSTNMSSSGRSNRFPFTTSQWQELEHQALIFKYMVSGIPIPPDLLFSIKTSFDSSLPSKHILQPQHGNPGIIYFFLSSLIHDTHVYIYNIIYILFFP